MKKKIILKKRSVFGLTLLLALLTCLASHAQEKNLDCDWCSISYPERAIPGERFEVKVTLKDVSNGLKIGGDLHHAKVGTYLGFAAWGGELKPAKNGETLVFKYRMPDYIADDRGVQPIYFLTKKGWNEAEKKAFGPVILPLMTDEVRKTIRPESVSFKKSWISYGTPRNAEGGAPVWKSGEKIVVPVAYYVDPTDDWGGTKLSLWIVGPWVDCPDGKYTKKREHKPSRCGVPDIECEIGKRVETSWTFTLPKAYTDAAPEKGKMGDSLLLIAQFKGLDKKFWPWQMRKSLPNFSRDGGFFELDAPTPGNLFTYDQKVEMLVIPGEKSKSLDPAALRWRVSNTQGKVVLSGEALFPPKKGGVLKLPMDIGENGTFLLRVELPGKETREITFARIPNIKAIVGNGPTPFGGQKFAGNEEAAQAARLLGMSVCRVWVNWKNLEPAPGVYPKSAWQELRRQIDSLNQNQIRPWILFDGAPAWAITKDDSYGGQFTALPLRDEDVARIVTRLAREFKNDIIGFEWQNEIVPGSVCENPVEDYVRFCRVADAASKKINPKFKNQIAGGLWPQSFRQSLIAAGVLDSNDILSIHYGTAGAVRGALRDIATVGADKRIEIWDNETALGTSTWGMPLEEAMRETAQSDYFLSRFPDELMAGCKKIVLFGGEASPAGDWSHFWSDMSPRPSAATLAVLVHALCDATPVGEFSIGKNGAIKLFERPGRPPIMVVSTIEKGGETIRLAVGNKKVFQIDQQGNRTEIPHKGTISLALNENAALIEGGDSNILKAYLALSFSGSASGTPTFSGVKGQTLDIPLRLVNRLARPLSGVVRLDAKSVPGETAALAFKNLAPGEERSVVMKVENIRVGTATTTLTLQFEDSTLPTLSRKIVLRAVESGEIGNLLHNAGFELDDRSPDAAAQWGGSGRQGKRVPFNDADALGHENFVYRFENTGGKYFSIFQNVPKLPTSGGEYVYSFWIRSDDLATGSNFGGSTEDGTSWNRHWLQVFQAPATQPTWQVFRKRLELPPGTKSVTAAPVCQGKGWTMIDNAQLVPYEGTEFAAFAPKAEKIKIDGVVDDFKQSAPIPLIGRDQVRAQKDSYIWSPKNCSAVAWINYDEENLYFAMEVLDDRHVATRREAECALNDSVRIAIHPMNRLPGEDARAFCLDLSSTPPGGSGKHTIYRPDQYSGGLKSGSLAKDSSVYDIVVKREGSRTTYEVAIPWSELGDLKGLVGTKIGLSLRLADCDDTTPSATPEAFVLWGEGLYPAWSPTSFGILTLTE
ncbi:MAG: hypothetical protein Q4D38_00715 [Planctomycetia bacterium]|nr:hypothetical protein [Planctomycetia bacterium]